ncbi:MAG: DUF3352 domain-containing protein [Chloroflexota bacterium]|nr:DUF3352 domain-containing protein [Chloroflexota bacterium]
MDDNDAKSRPGWRYDPETGQPLEGSLTAGDPRSPYASAAPSVAPVAPVAPYMADGTVKRRSRVPVVAGVALLVLLAGAALAAFWLFNRVTNPPALAAERVLPSNTVAYVTINPSPEGSQKEALDTLRAAFESQVGFKQAWARLAAQMGSRAGGAIAPGTLDFSTFSGYLGNNLTLAVLPPSTVDLQKLKDAAGSGEDALGDVMSRNLLGIVDLDLNPLNKKSPPPSAGTQTADISKAEVVEKYRQVEIRKYVTDTASLYFSLMEGTSTALVGLKVEPLRTAIDRFKEDTGLKDDTTFKELSGQAPQDRIGALYVNLGEVYRQARLSSPETFNNSSPLQEVDGAMLVTLRAESDGIELDVRTRAYTEGAGVQINPGARPDVRTLGDIPVNSLGFLVGTDLKSTVQSVLDALRNQSPSSKEELASTLTNMEQSTGLDLEKDLLPWMSGDYALSFTNPGPDDPRAVGTIFQLKLLPGDSEKAVRAVEQLAGPQSNSESEKIEGAGGTFYSLSPSSSAVLGVGANRLMYLFGNDVAGPKERLAAVMSGLGKGIATTAQWRDIARHLPRESNILGYVDLTGVRHIAELDLREDSGYEQDLAPFVRPLKYLLVGSASESGSSGRLARNRTVLFVGISK